MITRFFRSLCLVPILAATARAQTPAAAPALRWIILGTNGRPVANKLRSEPTKGLAPAQLVRVVTVTDNADLLVAGVKVRAARTSYFNTAAGPPADNGSQALAYRFEYGGRVIVYTGDTGPSAAVMRLAQGADLLVSEVIDLPAMSQLLQTMLGMDEATKQQMIDHFERQHLTSQEAGKMAATAAVKKLVFTHLAVTPATPASTFGLKLVAEAHATFRGDVVAQDLDQF